MFSVLHSVSNVNRGRYLGPLALLLSGNVEQYVASPNLSFLQVPLGRLNLSLNNLSSVITLGRPIMANDKTKLNVQKILNTSRNQLVLITPADYRVLIYFPIPISLIPDLLEGDNLPVLCAADDWRCLSLSYWVKFTATPQDGAGE